MRVLCRCVLLAVLVSAAANVGGQALYGSLLGNVTDERAHSWRAVTIIRRDDLTRDVVTDASGGYNGPKCCRDL